jgi:hypothetical protein
VTIRSEAALNLPTWTNVIVILMTVRLNAARRQRANVILTLPFPKLLSYWELPNLQVINRDIHITKSAQEAAYRKFARSPSLELGD